MKQFLVAVGIIMLIVGLVAWTSDISWFYVPWVISVVLFWFARAAPKPGKEIELHIRIDPDARADDDSHPERTTIPVRAKLKIVYVDSMGSATTRDIDVSAYEPDGGYIEGYCHLREEARTFRLDRIKSAIDLESGEVLAVTSMRSWLRKNRIR